MYKHRASRVVVALGALSLAALALTACGDDADDSSSSSGTVKLGFMGDLTGENKQLGNWMYDALKLRDTWTTRLVRGLRWSPL